MQNSTSSSAPAGQRSRGQEKRRYPRTDADLRVRIFRRSKKRGESLDFEAQIQTRDISVGGVYLESTFFLKRGVPIEMEFVLPEREQEVKVTGEVAHVIDDNTAGKPTGFAIRFGEFHDDSEIYLRAFLARGNLHSFVSKFAEKDFPKLPKGDHTKLVEMIVRWEMLQEALRSTLS